MITTYRELLRVELRHDYFLDGQLPDLAVVATPATAERLRRAGLLLRPQRSGVALLWPGDHPLTPAALNALKARVFPLVFALRPRTPAFQLYTDLPAESTALSQTYCFTSAPDDPTGQPAGGAPAAAAEPDHIFVALPAFLGLRPLVFDCYLRREPVQETSLGAAPMVTAGLWANGKQLAVWPPPADALPPYALALSPTIAAVDVRRWGSGHYQLRAGSQIMDFYADDDLHATRAWGLLEIGAEALARQSSPVYVLQFAARRVYWQYQVQIFAAGKLLLTLPALEIREAKRTGKDSSDFAIISPTPPGVSVIFRSNNSILLNEQYPTRHYELFALHSATRGVEPQWRKLHSALPQAEIRLLKSETTGTVAEIFVRVRF